MSKIVSSLNVIDVASLCSADWDAMTGDEQVRHCQQCDMNVYNLSEMTEDEALQLVQKREGRLCIQFYRREDGTMITKDCPVGLRAIRKAVREKAMRMWAKASALAGAIMVGGFFGRSSTAAEPIPKGLKDLPIPVKAVDAAQVVKGRMCVTPQAPQLVLTYDGLKMMPAKTLKEYLGKCLAKEEQAAYGMPDPDNKAALAENVRQAWQVKVEDGSFLPQPGTKEHGALAKLTADLLKKHADVALQISGPPAHLMKAIRGQMILRPIDAPIPR